MVKQLRRYDFRCFLSIPLPVLKLRRPTGVQWLAMEFSSCVPLRFTDTRCCRAAVLSASFTVSQNPRCQRVSSVMPTMTMAFRYEPTMTKAANVQGET